TMLRNALRVVSRPARAVQSVRSLSVTPILQHVRPLGPMCKLPEFKGTAVVDGDFKTISSNDYNGKWLIIFFYPLDFTFVCPTEIIAFGDRAKEFRDLGCEVVACSCDSHFSHLAWVQTPRKEGGLGDMNIPVLADFNKKIARNFGVLDEETGVSYRGLFLIDPNGNVRHTTCNDLPVGRSVSEALRVLKAFQCVQLTGMMTLQQSSQGSRIARSTSIKSTSDGVRLTMSDELFAIYGTEFEDLEEDEKLSRKPTRIEDEIVTDENGRRRFHGAFTGGFSAGYYNTVGTKEGWTPQEFRSSRDQRAVKFQQRAEDLMDEEDLGEFGIGARRIRTAEDFGSGRSAEKRMAWEHDVTSSAGTSMAMQLENIIRPVSDSIGKRMLRSMGWREGRGVGLTTAKSKRQYDEVDTEQMKAKAPGGFDPAAFGVGAFEEDDENIYSNYDLNQFDFALDAPGTSEEGGTTVDSTFVMSNKRLNPRKFYAPPKLPPNFRPAHRPKALETAKLPPMLQDAMKSLTNIQRAKLLGEDRVSVMELVSDKDRKRLERHRSRWDQREKSDATEEWKSSKRSFVPNSNISSISVLSGLVLPQPKELSVWEWESEKKEFEGKLTSEERGMLPEASKHDSDKMAAVKMGMFGERTRTTFQWRAREELHREEEMEKEAKEPKVDDIDRPPKSIFDAIFGESESESDSDEEEEEKTEIEVKKEESEQQEQKKVDTPEAVNEQPKTKPITVMDIVDDEEEFGPAPPTSTSETISGFSVLAYLKEEIEKRKESKKKHKSKKTKKEKSSKKSKKEKKSKKSRRKRHSSSSSSSGSSVVEVIE
ncbi:hypothetical protein GCK32_009655, partial [Trichostrongylus colubriformis]